MKKKQIKGLTNQIKIVDNRIIKKSKKHSDYFLNRFNEQKFYKEAQGLDFIKIPSKIEKNWQGRWKSEMPYFVGAKTLSSINLTKNTLQDVIDLIKKLHQKKIKLVIFNPQKFLNQFTKKVGVLAELEPLKGYVDYVISRFFSDDSKLVLSHNDLIKDNFLILDDRIYLIDFEYASLNHPLFDYASFISESLSFNQAKKFEKLLNLTPKEQTKLHQLELYQDFLWAHWAEFLYRRTKKEIYRQIRNQKIKNAWKRSRII